MINLWRNLQCHKRRSARIAAMGMMLIFLGSPCGLVWALPQGQDVINGDVSFTNPDANTLNININSDQSIIQYNSFNIAAGETVNFFMPSTDAFSLNRVVAGGDSQIFGNLFANGNLILLNQNGINFGAAAQVNVGSLMASTQNLSNVDFLNRQYIFAGTDNNPNSFISNEGNITTSNGGFVVLAADAIRNTGTIEAPLGTVILAGGKNVTVNLTNDGLVNVAIDEAVAQNVLDSDGNPITDQLKNSGTLRGATVKLDAKSAANIYQSAINQDGIIRADQVSVGQDGIVEITASGLVKLGGSIAADQTSVQSDTNITVDTALITSGNTILAAKNNIDVNANVTTDSGSLSFLADSDLNGQGAFTQAIGTTIRTTTFGDITIQGSGESVLGNIVSAGNITLQDGGASAHFTQLSGSVLQSGGSFTIDNGVSYSASNAVLSISKDWLNYGSFDAGLSLVKLVGSLDASVMANNVFNDLEIIEPSKNVEFEAGKTQEITGTLTVSGQNGKMVNIQSTNNEIPAILSILGNYRIEYAQVKNITSVNIHGPPTAGLHLQNLGGNTGWDFSSGVVFIGSVSSDWSDALNWDGGFVPGAFDLVRFNASSGSASLYIDTAIAGLFLESDYTGTLSLGSSTLTISGDFSVRGGNFQAGTSTVVFNDASQISHILGNNTFYNFMSVTPSKVIQFEAGKTQTILGNWKLEGAFAQHVRLVSTESGNQWLVDPRGSYDISYSWVEDSHSLRPGDIIMTESSNRGNSIGWDPVATWTGASSANWNDAGNWSGLGGVTPGMGDDLLFPDGAANLSNTNDFAADTLFNSLTISGSGYTLAGNSIIIGAGAAGITDSSAAGSNTISLPIKFLATRTITVTDSATTLTISGIISDAGGLTKEGAGKLILSGANTYSGTTKVNYGVLNIQNANALGTIAGGTEVVEGAGLQIQGNIAVGAEALLLRGNGFSSAGALRNISGDNSYGGAITLVAGGAEISSDAGTLTLNGGISGAFPLIVDGAGNVTFASTPIATAAGTLTKNGAGTLTFNFTNTFTGLTTLNAGTLLYGTHNALSTGAVTVLGGTFDVATFSDSIGTLTLNGGVVTGSTGVLSSTATYDVRSGTISAVLGGAVGLTKTTSGTVVLSGANIYTGTTTVSAGILSVQNNLALGDIDGATTVTSGATLQIDGNGLSIAEAISTLNGVGVVSGTSGVGALRNLANNNTWTGAIALGAASTIYCDAGTLTISTTGITGNTFGLTVDGPGNVTLSTAPLNTTTGTLTKNGAGTLTMQSFNTYTGVTTINAGTLVLSGNGASTLSTFTINSGAALTLDNSGTTGVDRMGDTLAVTMNGGDLNIIGHGSTYTNMILGALTLSSGENTITITPGAAGTGVTFASFSRSAGATALFRGTSFGSAPGAGVSSLFFVTESGLLTGGEGSANSTTISIIAGAFGDNSLSGTGTDMVTYNEGNSNGLRLLNGAGFSGEYLSNSFTTTNANVKLTAATNAATGTINSLIIDSGGSIADAGTAETITFTTGNILSLSGNSGISGANTTLAFGTVQASTRVVGDLAISAAITGTGGLATGGAGTLTFSTAQAYTGLTSINDTTFLYVIDNAISTGALTINNGILNLSTFSDSVAAVILTSGSISGSGTLTSTASFTVSSGTVTATLNGGVALTKTTVGTVTLSGNNSYTGLTTISAGVLKLGATGSGANTPLGTTGAGTSVTSGAALDLNGFTLATAEGLTINGTGIALGGALMNSSATPVSYSGNIILGAASRINANSGTLTLNGGISGAFGLTVGGAGNSTISGVISTVTSLTKDGTGTLTLSGDNTMAGTTTVSVGTLKLGANGGGTNTPLGTTAAGTSVTSGAVLDLNGFSLGTTEGLTINGTGINGGGALINSAVGTPTYQGAIALGSASTITSNNGAITLSGAFSGAFALTLDGTSSGTISGVVGTGAGTITKVGTGTWTLSNAGSTYTGLTTISAGTLKLGANGGATNTPLGTTGGATVVNSGAVLDLNGFALGTAEGLTLNGMGIANGGALITNAASTFLGAITLASDTRIANSGAGTALTLNGGVTTAGFLLTVGGAGNTTFSTAAVAGAGGIIKEGAGTLTMNVSSSYTGATLVKAGTFTYGASGLLAVTALTVTGGTFDINTISDAIGTVTLLGGSITGTTGVLTSTGYTVENGTIDAILAGAVTLVKNTTGTVTMTKANTYSGASTINAGTLTLSGSGTAVSSAFTINSGATLTLDNSGTNVASRLGDAVALTMNGGNFYFIGNGAAAASETAGALTLSSGYNIVTVTVGAGGSTIMTFASASRTAGATVLFRGNSLGNAPAANVANIRFTNATGLGLTGANTTATDKPIVPYAFGEPSGGGTGTSFVTHNVDLVGNAANTNGIRPLDLATEYVADSFAAGSANKNVIIQNATNAAAQTINSLLLYNASVSYASDVTITVTSGAVARVLAGDIEATSASATRILAFAGVEAKIFAIDSFYIAPNITGTAGLSTGGTGTLTFPGAGTFGVVKAYTGTTTINSGTLTYGLSDALSSGAVTVVGGTYNLAGFSDSIGALTMNGGTVTTGAGTLTLGGTVTTLASIRESTISGNLGLGANRIFDVADGLVVNDLVVSAVISGGFTVTKSTGTGTLVFSGDNTYTGVTTISSGIFKLGASGGGVNTPLGTTAAGTVISNGAAFDLNGFTLGTAEGLTINGTGVSSSGALFNSSGTAVTYSGLLVIGATAPTITANNGNINISNVGTITGAAVVLTLSGSGNGSVTSIIGTPTSGLTKTGAGTWTLSGDSTYATATTISAGVIKLGAAGGGTNTPLGTTAAGTVVSSGAALDLNGFTLGTAEGLTISGAGIVSGGSVGALINSSGSSVTYSGQLLLGASSTITANNGDINLSAVGTITGAGFALTLNGSGNGSLASVVGTVGGTVVKNGQGTWTLSGSSTYTGATTVNAGTLKLGATGGGTNTPLGTTGTGTTVNAGAVLDLNGFTLGTTEGLTLNGSGINNGGALVNNSGSATGYSGAIVMGSATRITNSGAGLLTLSGATTGAFNLSVGGAGDTTISANITTAGITLTKDGAGTLTLSAANGFTGLTRVDAGTLKYGIANALNTGAVTIAGGTLDISGFSDTNLGALTLISGSVINSGGAATITSTATYTLESGTVSAVLAGVGIALNKNTAGTVTINASQTYTGTTTINAGILTYGASGLLAATAINVSGGTYDINSISDTVGAVTLTSGYITGTTGVLTGTSYAVQSGTISAILGGAVALTKTTSGTVILSGLNTYTGVTTITAGTLSVSVLANGGASSGIGAAAALSTNLVFNGGTLQYTGTGHSTDRLFTINTTITAIIDASGSGTASFTGASITYQTNNTIHGLTLTGRGNGSFTPVIANMGTGVTSVTKNGTGTWTLNGTSTYTGTTTVNAGTFAYGASNILAVTALTVSGGTFSMAGFSDTIGAVNLTSGSITSTTGVLTGTSYAVQRGTISAILAGAVTMTKTTAGTVVLSGVNTYSGVTTITAGVLSVGTIGNGGVSGNLGAAAVAVGNIVLNSTGVLQYTGSTASTNRGFTLTAAATSFIDITQSGTILTVSGGSAANTGGLTKIGAGTLTFSAAVSYTGTTTITAGTLAYGAANILSTGAVTVDGATAVLAMGNNQSDTVGTVTVSSGGSITGSGTSALTTTGTFEMQSGSVSAILAGAVALNKTTSGTVTLSGVNTYTGVTTISAGTLSVGTIGNGGVAGNLGAAAVAVGNIVIGGTGVLQYTGGTASTNRGFTITAGQTGTIDVSNGAATLTISGGTATNSGALTKIGAGTLTFTTTAATYTGTTTINAGTLSYGMANMLSSGAVTVDGATAVLALGLNQSDTVGTVTVANGGSITGTGTSSLTSTGTFEMQSGSVSAILAGATIVMNKTTAGTVTLSGVNTFTGLTTISAGTLTYGVNDALSNGGVTVSGGTLSLLTFNETNIGAVTLTSGSITSTTGVLTGTSYAVQSGSISAILAGAVALNKTTSGTVTLSGVNTYTGVTTISAGTLSVGTIGNGGVAGNLGAAAVAVGNIVIGGTGVLQYTGGTASTNRGFTITAGQTGTIDVSNGAATLTISGGTATNSGALTKIGAGTLTFTTTAATYTGTTTINAGTLSYGMANMLSSGAVTVDGATAVLALGLNQSDTVGTVTVANGGSITGTGTSSLTSTGTFEMQSGSVTAILAGAVALNKTTSGTVTLTGVNTYSGITTITSGTLSVAADSGLGTAPGSPTAGHLAFNGGALQTTAGFTLNSNRGVALTGDGTFLVDPATTLVYNGIITGTGALSKTGTGTLTLGGSVTSGGLTVTAGTFGASGVSLLDVNGNVLINGGTLTPPALNFTVSGDWTVSSGTFNAGSGRVVFDGSGTQQVSVGGQSFYEFTHTGSGTVQLVTSAFSANAFTNSNGTFSLNGQNFTVSSSSFTNTANMELQGNETVSINSPYVVAGTWTYRGRNIAETLTIKDFGAIDYYNLTINDTNGTKATFSIADSLVVSGTLTLSGGNLTQASGSGNTITAAIYAQSGGSTFTGGNADMTINGDLGLSGADTIFTTSSATTQVITLTVNSSGSGELLMASGATLRVTGSGTPVTGTGTIDTTTNGNNTFEFTGAADISTASPFYNLSLIAVPFSQGGILTLNYDESAITSVVIDTTNGFGYFGTGTSPGIIIKVRLADNSRVGALTLASGENNLTTAVMDGQYAYFGTYTTSAKVVKVDLSTFTRVSAVSLSAGQDYLYASVVDTTNHFAYFGTYTAPGKIIKINTASGSFAYVGELDMGSVGANESYFYNNAAVLDTENNFAYFGTYTENGASGAYVVKINTAPAGFAYVGNIALANGEDNIASAVIDLSGATNYAYFGTDTAPGQIVKVNLNTFTRVGAATGIVAGEDNFTSAVIDTANQFAYFGTDTAPGKIVKIDLATFAKTSTITLNSGEDYLYSAAIDTSNNFAYFGNANNPGYIIKVNTSTGSFARVSSLQTNVAENWINSAVIDTSAGFAYFGTYNAPGVIVKVRLSDNSRVGVLTLSAGEDYLSSAVIDTTSATHYAYFGTNSNPGTIVKINLSSFTRVGAATGLAATDDYFTSAVIYTNTYAYFGTNTASGAYIVKIDLSSFSKSGSSLQLNNGEDYLTSAVIDGTGTFAYFGTNTSTGHIVKVSLAGLTRVGEISGLATDDQFFTSAVIDNTNNFAYFGTNDANGATGAYIVKINTNTFQKVGSSLGLNDGEDYLTSAVIDVTNGYAYFGTYTDPGIVVKIRLSDFTRNAAVTLTAGNSNLAAAVIDVTNSAAYFGTDTTIPARVIKINLGGQIRIISLLTVTNNLTIGDLSTPTLVAALANILVGGNWTNYGTFSAGTYTVTLNGGDGVNQHIYGSTTFYNLTKDMSSGTQDGTLTFESGAGNQTNITNTLLLKGNAKYNLKLRSSSAAQFYLNPTNTATLSDLNIQNSNNAGASLTANSSVNSGGNSGWTVNP